MAAGGQPVTPWNVLSGMISKRVGDMRARKQKQEDDVFQAKLKNLSAGIEERIKAGENISQEEIDREYGELSKGAPKEAQPLIAQMGKTLWKVATARRHKQQGQQGKQGQQGQSGQPPASKVPAADPPAPTGASGGGQAPQTPAPTPPSPQATPQAPVAPSIGLSAERRGALKGQQEAAEDKVLQQSRKTTVDAMRQSYANKGEGGESGLSKEENHILDIWAATGAFPPAALMHSKRHPVTIEDPAGGGGLIPAMVDEDGTTWANGQEITNPRIMPKWKPRMGWTKLGPNQFMSFNIDPMTNQPIPGTESTQNLPPSAYLDKVREGAYHWTDDSGNVHESPFTTRSFANVPSNATGKGATPAVPPAMAKLPKTKTGAGAGAKAGDKAGAGAGRVLGTKDTGVLNPVAQRALIQIEPVANQARKLEKIFDDHPELKDNDQAGYLLMPYILYRLGYATDGALQEEIAGLSLGSVIEAASVLQGTSRSISALRLAMVHTPNPKLDSPKQIYRKLHNDIIPRLDDIMSAANKYGRKRAVSTEGAATGAKGAGAASALPPDIKGGPKSADQQAEEYLKAHP